MKLQFRNGSCNAVTCEHCAALAVDIQSEATTPSFRVRDGLTQIKQDARVIKDPLKLDSRRRKLPDSKKVPEVRVM